MRQPKHTAPHYGIAALADYEVILLQNQGHRTGALGNEPDPEAAAGTIHARSLATYCRPTSSEVRPLIERSISLRSP